MLSQHVQADPTLPRQFQALRDEIGDYQALLARPVDVLYIVAVDGVSEMTPAELMNAFRGGTEASEIEIFMDRTAADKYHERQTLIRKATKALANMKDENLETVVQMIEHKKVEEVAQFLAEVLG